MGIISVCHLKDEFLCFAMSEEQPRVERLYRVYPKQTEKTKIKRRKYMREYYASHALLRLAVYKRTAIKKKRQFSISDDYAVSLFREKCLYCDQRMDGMLNGIDRFDNSKGYIAGNCVPCCGRCNRAKGTMSGEDFVAMCTAVANGPLKRS